MKTRFFELSAIAIALLVLTAGTAFAASASLATADDRTPTRMFVPQVQAPSVEVATALDALLYTYDVVELPLAKLERQVRTTNRLDIFLGGERFELQLEINDLRAPGYKEILMTDAGPVEIPERPVSTYAGTVAGHPDSVVRLTSTRGLFSGYVKTADDWLFVDPLRQFVPNAPARAAVVYREADVRPEASGQCGVTHRLQVGEDQTGLDTGVIAKNHTLRRLQVATDADGEYFQRYGNPGLFNRIQGILNDVDGIYRNQINLYIQITYQQGWSNPSTDPYSTNSASTNLTQMRNWWNANRGGTVRDTAHMFSGKTFSSGTIGIAWVGVICNAPSYSYGISQDLSSGAQRARLTAHEIGHNLSAQHDNQIGCAGVNCNGFGPIMCSFIQTNGSNTFSNCSWNAINNHTHAYPGCLN